MTGTGYLGVGAQETLALNGSVSLTGDNGSVSFNGWYGTLQIDDAAGFSSSTPIYSFNPGDTIDLKNVPYVSSASSYSFNYGSPNDLKITEGAQTINLNVGTYYGLSGLLTLKPDASGTGTDIVYTSGGASPFQQWGSPLSNFFTTSSGPVDGSYWGSPIRTTAVSRSGSDAETPASTYVAGQSEPYSIVLTTQDWIGTEQPLLTVTTTNLIDPFGSGSQDVGNLAGSLYVSNNGATGTMDLIYWQASTTPGDYAVEFQPITTTYVSGPSTGPSTVLTGSPIQLDAAVSQPLSWISPTTTPRIPPRPRRCSPMPLSRPQRPRTSTCRDLRPLAPRRLRRSLQRSRTGHGIASTTTRGMEISTTTITRRRALPEPDFTLKLSIRPRARWAARAPIS